MRPALLLALVPLLAAGDAREVASREGANLQSPTWSPNGDQLSYEANFHDKKSIELWVGDPHANAFSQVDPADRGTSAITVGFASAKRSSVVHELSWSPAAMGRFVYSASTDRLDYDLFIQGAGAVAPGQGADGGPAWSPDGMKIAFTSARTGQGDVYLVDVTEIDAPPRQVSTNPRAAELYVTWSPDGESLAWVEHTDSGDNIWLLPELGGTAIQLTNGSTAETRPRFSPTGDRLAFYRSASGDFDTSLWVVEARAGASARRIAAAVIPNATGPTWTPQGTHLVYTENNDASYDPVVVARVDDPRRLHRLDLGTVGHGDLDLASGAGQTLRLAVIAQGRNADIERGFKRLFVAEIPLPLP